MIAEKEIGHGCYENMRKRAQPTQIDAPSNPIFVPITTLLITSISICQTESQQHNKMQNKKTQMGKKKKQERKRKGEIECLPGGGKSGDSGLGWGIWGSEPESLDDTHFFCEETWNWTRLEGEAVWMKQVAKRFSWWGSGDDGLELERIPKARDGGRAVAAAVACIGTNQVETIDLLSLSLSL